MQSESERKRSLINDLMAVSSCLSCHWRFRQEGGWFVQWYRKIELRVERRSGCSRDKVFVELGLGLHGCTCQAAENYEPGYKRSALIEADFEKQGE